ncbi:MAG: hypothetical protein J0I10_09535 [Verrucomicrobia bacterium]|nr:hypothetical protein [Verrucomicrobiota bacterium]
MNRAFAILIAITLFGLAVLVGATEQRCGSQTFDMTLSVISSIAQTVCVLGMVCYCGFAAMHSTQYLTSPKDRSIWLIVILGMNVVGACWYFLTRYQAFRKEGKGRLMPLS